MMRIAINCHSFLKKNYTGIGRYTYNLLKSLSSLDRQNQYFLYVKRGFFELNKRIPDFAVKNFKIKMDYFKEGPERVLGAIDIYHSPCPDFFKFQNGAKVIVTVHDVIFKAYPHGHTQSALETTRKQFDQFLAKAAKIICCSKSTIEDLQKFYDVPRERTALIYQGVDKNIFYQLRSEERLKAKRRIQELGLKERFLLFVGTIEPRKNLGNVLQAFEQLKNKKRFAGQLVVAGMRGWLMENLEEMIGQLKFKEDVIFLGYLADEDLNYLYNLAEIFVFPSLYEGFGYPILEAFSCAAAVVTSNVSSCPEIAADAALTVDPQNPGAIAAAVVRILEDQSFRKTLQEKALKRSQDFSFEKTARETLKVYEEVYNAS